MSKAVVSSAAKRLSKMVIHEADFLYVMHRQQAFTLRNKLKRLQSYLEDADAKQETNARIYIWVADVKETAYDAEDAIKTIIEANAHTPTGVIGAFLGFFHKFILLRKVDMDIKKILIRINDINYRLSKYNIMANVEGGHDQVSSSSTEISRRRQLRQSSYRYDEEEDDIDFLFEYITALVNKQDIDFRRITYNIISNVEGDHDQASSSSTEISRRRQLRQRYPHDEDEDVIGLEEHITSLVNELTTENNSRGESPVVSIIGVGGLGKTTLAKKVYNHEIVKRHFNCCAWVFISHEQFNAKAVLKEIGRQVGAPAFHQETQVENQMRKLKAYLGYKRYLVVLDDELSAKDWGILRHAFPWNGSKILLTTRNSGVAFPVFTLKPRFLNKEESWELFCKKATRRGINSISDNFEILGREMVGKCGGLPLAIVVLGGLLSTKRSIKEWEVVSINLNYHLSKSESEVLKILLSLSYNDLPYNLKPCFLYLEFISKANFEISTKQLINLWIAEGFIQEENDHKEESVGEQLLHELIDRCIVQKGKLSVTGKVKTCRLHALIQNMCLLMAEEENFYHHGENWWPQCPYSSRASSLFSGLQLRRYACHACYYFFDQYSFPHLRTLLVIIQPYRQHYSRNINIRFGNYKLLGVLVLDGDNANLAEVGCLFHLRYLGLIGMDLEELPASIGNLRNLQTLDLSRSIVYSIPNTIWKMKQLRHLYLNDSSRSRVSDGPFGIGNLRYLKTLNCIHAGNWIKETDLQNLTNLCELRIYGLSRSQVEVVIGSIVVKSLSWNTWLLRSLSLELFDPYEGFPNLEPLTHCSSLSKLSLNGIIMQAELQNFPSYLTKLSLTNSGLEYDPMETLQDLPNLVCLRLCSAYVGKHMVCYAKGFPELQFLLLSTLQGLVKGFLNFNFYCLAPCKD